MGRKRFKDQIDAEILKACRDNGMNKTAIVYRSGMNFKTIVPYLDLLIENELLEIINDHLILYKTTQKGLNALNCFKELEELIPEFGLASSEKISSEASIQGTC
jgi:predicted transcriptional regulator